MSGYESGIAVALAELLATELGGSWSPVGAYPAVGAGPVLFLRHMPDLDRDVLSLSTYEVLPPVGPTDGILGVQVRSRCPGQDPTKVDDLDGAVCAALHERAFGQLGGYPVSKVMRQSGTSLGQDSNSRWNRVANYYVSGVRTPAP